MLEGVREPVADDKEETVDEPKKDDDVIAEADFCCSGDIVIINEKSDLELHFTSGIICTYGKHDNNTSEESTKASKRLIEILKGKKGRVYFDKEERLPIVTGKL